MDNEDLDALAAEYVLGTLAPDERSRAEALITGDPAFGEAVHQWERRLGELNVMVEAVEPPNEIWDKIKSGMASVTPSPGVPDHVVPMAPTEPPAFPEAEVETKPEGRASMPLPPAANLSFPEGKADATPEAQPSTDTVLLAPVPPTTPEVNRGADIIDFRRRMQRWRGLAVGAFALAAALAALIIVSQVNPALIARGGFRIPQLIAQRTPPGPAAAPPSGSRLVAVLQQAPFAPAFLLTIDPASKTLTARRIAARAQAGHSYELWLFPPNSTTPQALGVVGEQEFTQPKLPADVDSSKLRAATYAISFEPAGGSKTGAPSGPILFTGKLVESVAPVAAPATPKS
jgi:anti-sigma-K factor RskA